MSRPIRTPNSLAKVSVKNPTALPRAKREVKTINKSSAKVGDPFASFSEWSGEADEKAYAKL
jgi:hypothetical protein